MDVQECPLVHSHRAALSLPTLLVACPTMLTLSSLPLHLASSPQTLVLSHHRGHNLETLLLLFKNLLALPLLLQRELEVTKLHLILTSHLQPTLPTVLQGTLSLVNHQHPPLSAAVPAGEASK